MSPLDPRLERHKPALVYDPQEAYRAMSAESIVDYPNNTLERKNGSVVARAGTGLSLEMLTTYPFRDGDRLDEAGDPLPAARRFQADAAYRERVYGRVKEDGGRVWLQYWLWCYYNPKQLLGFGKHEGDWEVVQVGLGSDGAPEVVTFSQHEGAEARDWEAVKRQGDHPVVYVAPLSHACYFEPGAHPYVLGVDNPDGRLPPVLPRVEAFGAWTGWKGRWGNSTGVAGGQFGGRSPASPGRQGQKWDHPAAWHQRARAATPLRRARGVVRAAGKATLSEAARPRGPPRGRARARRLRDRHGTAAPPVTAPRHASPRGRRGAAARELPDEDLVADRERRGAAPGGRRGRRRGARVGVQRAPPAQRSARGRGVRR